MFCLEVKGKGVKEREQGMGEEMAQTMYAHMNKEKKKKELLQLIPRY
jgi:hypothetical protein